MPGHGDELTDDEIDDLVGDIEDIVMWENAGFPTDWADYPYSTKRLVSVWRNAELDAAALQTSRMQIFLKSWFKE